MDQKFFHISRTYKTGPARPEPRIKLFHIKEQQAVNEEFISIGKSLGFTPEEIETEWFTITEKATAAATAAWTLNAGLTPENPVRPNKDTKDALECVYGRGLAIIHGETKARATNASHWLVQRTLSLSFPDGRFRKVYVKRQRVHSRDGDGKRRYKIGDSIDPYKRGKQHSTSNSDLEDICCLEGCEIVTERNVHNLFSGCLEHGRDWFALTDEQADILLDRSRVVTAIRRMLETRM